MPIDPTLPYDDANIFAKILRGEIPCNRVYEDEWTLALPATVLQSQYSREFESEADVYAFERMAILGLDPVHFGNALHRFTTDALQDSPLSAKDSQRAETFLKYLSSHPPSEERAAMAKTYSQRYQASKPPVIPKD